MNKIAGHEFGIGGTCECGKRFSDISWVATAPESETLDKPDIAHNGQLNTFERQQIIDEVERIWKS